MNNEGRMWWRVLIPSWRFFDQIGAAPRLAVREPGGPWRLIPAPLKGNALSLFVNPIGNRSHARNNLMERLLVEAQESASVETLVSFHLVAAIAREAAAEMGLHKSLEFQILSHGESVLTASLEPPTIENLSP